MTTPDEAAQAEAERRYPHLGIVFDRQMDNFRDEFVKACAWQRSQPVDVTETMVGAVIAALGAHRWKTMGVGTVECECGEVMSGPGVLEGNFPADEAFRDHLARAALRAALEGETE